MHVIHATCYHYKGMHAKWRCFVGELKTVDDKRSKKMKGRVRERMVRSATGSVERASHLLALAAASTVAVGGRGGGGGAFESFSAGGEDASDNLELAGKSRRSGKRYRRHSLSGRPQGHKQDSGERPRERRSESHGGSKRNSGSRDSGSRGSGSRGSRGGHGSRGRVRTSGSRDVSPRVQKAVPGPDLNDLVAVAAAEHVLAGRELALAENVNVAAAEALPEQPEVSAVPSAAGGSGCGFRAGSSSTDTAASARASVGPGSSAFPISVPDAFAKPAPPTAPSLNWADESVEALRDSVFTEVDAGCRTSADEGARKAREFILGWRDGMSQLPADLTPAANAQPPSGDPSGSRAPDAENATKPEATALATNTIPQRQLTPIHPAAHILAETVREQRLRLAARLHAKRLAENQAEEKRLQKQKIEREWMKLGERMRDERRVEYDSRIEMQRRLEKETWAEYERQREKLREEQERIEFEERQKAQEQQDIKKQMHVETEDETVFDDEETTKLPTDPAKSNGQENLLNGQENLLNGQENLSNREVNSVDLPMSFWREWDEKAAEAFFGPTKLRQHARYRTLFVSYESLQDLAKRGSAGRGNARGSDAGIASFLGRGLALGSLGLEESGVLRIQHVSTRPTGRIFSVDWETPPVCAACGRNCAASGAPCRGGRLLPSGMRPIASWSKMARDLMLLERSEAITGAVLVPLIGQQRLESFLERSRFVAKRIEQRMEEGWGCGTAAAVAHVAISYVQGQSVEQVAELFAKEPRLPRFLLELAAFDAPRELEVYRDGDNAERAWISSLNAYGKWFSPELLDEAAWRFSMRHPDKVLFFAEFSSLYSFLEFEEIPTENVTWGDKIASAVSKIAFFATGMSVSPKRKPVSELFWSQPERINLLSGSSFRSPDGVFKISARFPHTQSAYFAGEGSPAVVTYDIAEGGQALLNEFFSKRVVEG